MKSDLPVGSWIRYRWRNLYEYGRIVENARYGKPMGGILKDRIDEEPLAFEVASGDDVPVGTVVHQGVWKKGAIFQVRRTYTHSGPRPDDRRREPNPPWPPKGLPD